MNVRVSRQRKKGIVPEKLGTLGRSHPLGNGNAKGGSALKMEVWVLTTQKFRLRNWVMAVIKKVS